jgi:hypothetical protein
MIPNQENYDEEVEEDYNPDFTIETQPSLTWAMNINEPEMLDEVKNSFIGKVDEEDAVLQAAMKILQTERGAFDIYSDDYGIELEDLRGRDMIYCESEVPVRIKEALMVDDRIENVSNFSVERSDDRRALHVSFTIETADVDVSMETEVEV